MLVWFSPKLTEPGDNCPVYRLILIKVGPYLSEGANKTTLEIGNQSFVQNCIVLLIIRSVTSGRTLNVALGRLFVLALIVMPIEKTNGSYTSSVDFSFGGTTPNILNSLSIIFLTTCSCFGFTIKLS